MAFNFLLSDDIFISYSRRDAATYAPGLADKIMEKGFSCFYDRFGTDPNRDLPPSLKKKIRGCKMFVLLATEGAAKSRAVGQEIEEFKKTGRASRIVPVDVDGSLAHADWFALVEGIAPETEKNPDALVDGNPSPAVVSRVEKSFRYLRGKDKLRAATTATALVLAALLAAIGWSILEVADQLGQAAEATMAAAFAQADAAEQQRIAEEQGKKAADAAALAQSAEAAKALADAAKAEAVRQQQAAEEQKKDAERLRDQARAEAQRQAAIADSRSLANRSQTLLRQRPEEVQRSLSLAVESMKKSSSVGLHAVESDTALRESLALFPRRRASHTYAEGEALGEVNAVALSPDGRHFASLTNDGKLRVFESGGDKPLQVLDCQCSEVALNSGATLAAAVTNEGGVEIFDLKTGRGRPFTGASGDPPEHLALSPGGRYLALTARLGESDGQHSKLSVLDVSGGQVVKTFDDYIDTPGDREGEGGDKKADASGGESNGVKQGGDITSGACGNLNMVINDVAFGPSGNLAVAGKYNSPRGFRLVGRVVVWDLELYAEGSAVERELSEANFAAPEVVQQDDAVLAVAPGADATYFATDTGVWKRLAGRSEFEPVARLPHPLLPPLTSLIQEVAFGPGGTSLTLFRTIKGEQNSKDNDEGVLETWDSMGHRDLARVLQPEEVGGLSFKPGGEFVAAMAEHPAPGPARVFGATDGREADGIPFDLGATQEKAHGFSQSADFIIVADDKTAAVWDVWAKRKTTATLDGTLRDVGAAAISPGGKFFALIGEDKDGVGSVIIYRRDGASYRKWKSIRKDARELEDPVAVSLSADGRRVAVHYTYDEDFVRVWDVRDAGDARDASPDSLKAASSVRTLEMMLSPDGRFLVFTDIDGLTRLLDLSKGKKAGWETLLDSTTIQSRAFSPDGRYLGLGSDEGVLYVFDTKASGGVSEIARLQHTGKVTAVAFSDDGRYVATASSARNRFDNAESYPLRVWLLRPSNLLAEAEARADSVRE